MIPWYSYRDWQRYNSRFHSLELRKFVQFPAIHRSTSNPYGCLVLNDPTPLSSYLGFDGNGGNFGTVDPTYQWVSFLSLPLGGVRYITKKMHNLSGAMPIQHEFDPRWLSSFTHRVDGQDRWWPCSVVKSGFKICLLSLDSCWAPLSFLWSLEKNKWKDTSPVEKMMHLSPWQWQLNIVKLSFWMGKWSKEVLHSTSPELFVFSVCLVAWKEAGDDRSRLRHGSLAGWAGSCRFSWAGTTDERNLGVSSQGS